jgi:glyoxylase I family protein
MATIILFSHVALACKDPAATEAFYVKHFGLRRARVIGTGRDQVVFLGSRASPVYLELFASKGDEPVPAAQGAGPESPGFRHLAFQVEDLDAKLAEMGPDAKLTLGPLDFGSVIPGWRTAWLADPDGRVVEISQGFIDQLEAAPAG